jgi:hypothetical protein
MPRQRMVLIGAAVLAVLTVSACDIDVLGERGSGTVVTESRTVSEFDEIVLSGSGEVFVDVNGTESLTIKAEDNILPLLTSEVRNGRLELGTRSSISPTVAIVYTISAAALSGVSIEGSGDITATGITGDSFDAEISGSGQIEVAGAVDELTVGISGSGRFEGEDLFAATGTADVSGSGHAIVNVSDNLEAEISGSGTVEYIGDPDLNSSISGSGDIKRR